MPLNSFQNETWKKKEIKILHKENTFCISMKQRVRTHLCKFLINRQKLSGKNSFHGNFHLFAENLSNWELTLKYTLPNLKWFYIVVKTLKFIVLKPRWIKVRQRHISRNIKMLYIQHNEMSNFEHIFLKLLFLTVRVPGHKYICDLIWVNNA